MNVIGFDTSNYTTSIAAFDGTEGINHSQLLPVKAGQLGLRQSDAVFHHTQSLPELTGRLFSNLSADTVAAVGVSTRPRAVEGSYMPCFTVGYSHAKLLADALHVPLFICSHQQGHIAAAAFSGNRMDLLDQPHLAWHLSGGTTELLLVKPNGMNVDCERIGGTTDISAGQLIDRTGQLLELLFPAGKALDTLSQSVQLPDKFAVKCSNMEFSLSGVQNKVESYYASHNDKEKTAAYALASICHAVFSATQNALKAYPDLPIIFSGGVSANTMLRKEMEPFSPVFAKPQFSTDNALGVAILTYRAQEC